MKRFWIFDSSTWLTRGFGFWIQRSKGIKEFYLVLVALLSVLYGSAYAQQAMKIPKMGLLFATSPSVSPARVEAFRRGLRELGYQEGKNIVIEYRYAEGKLDRLPALASELIGLKVDVIVTTGGL